MKTYAEKLRDPRWQKKRLEIMQRDGFACCNCGDSESTLNIHHWYYQKATEPWDYPNDALSCLCEDCHVSIEWVKKDIQERINHPVIQDAVHTALCNVSFIEINQLASAFCGYNDNTTDKKPINMLRACIVQAESLISELRSQVMRMQNSIEGREK